MRGDLRAGMQNRIAQLVWRKHLAVLAKAKHQHLRQLLRFGPQLDREPAIHAGAAGIARAQRVDIPDSAVPGLERPQALNSALRAFLTG